MTASHVAGLKCGHSGAPAVLESQGRDGLSQAQAAEQGERERWLHQQSARSNLEEASQLPAAERDAETERSATSWLPLPIKLSSSTSSVAGGVQRSLPRDARDRGAVQLRGLRQGVLPGGGRAGVEAFGAGASDGRSHGIAVGRMLGPIETGHGPCPP